MRTTDDVVNTILGRLEDVEKEKIEDSIKLYKLLIQLYEQKKTVEFRWAYAAYYGLSSHYKKRDLINYFSVLDKYKSQDAPSLNLNSVVKELKTEKNHYVFASKLMSFVDDNTYPIIDFYIIRLFKFAPKESYKERYRIIKETYDILYKTTEIVDYIKEVDRSGIGKMKILDIIVWNISKMIHQQQQKR